MQKHSQAGQGLLADNAVFPGIDEDNDDISDFNRNFNAQPGYVDVFDVNRRGNRAPPGDGVVQIHHWSAHFGFGPRKHDRGLSDTPFAVSAVADDVAYPLLDKWN